MRIPLGIATLVGLLSLAFPITALAQDEGAVLVDLRIDRVQPGDEDRYISLQTQIAATLKAKNHGPRDVWMEIGETSGVFHIISPTNVAPVAEDLSLPITRSSERMTLRLYPELTLPPATGAASQFLSLTYAVVGRDSRDAYFAWIRDYLRPQLQSAGAGGVVFSRVATETDTDTWIMAANASDTGDTVASTGINSELVKSSRIVMLRHIPFASVGVE